MKRRSILVGLIFIVVTLLFFYPIFNGKIPFPGDLLIGEYAPYNSYRFLGYDPGGYPNKGQSFDALRLLYPEKEFSIGMFKNFELPFWNPYIFSGNPHIASLQSGSFYPLNVIFFFLPFVYAWALFILLQPILTGLFTFLFARELRLTYKSSIFSALIFAFSSYSVVWMEYGNVGYSIAWMPFALWMSLKNLQKQSLFKSILISLGLTFSIMAGYIQTTFYVIIFLAFFVLFHTLFVYKEERLKKLSLFLSIFIFTILFSSMQLLPMFELIFQSARTSYSQAEFFKLLIPPFHLITMFVPDFFGNPATRNYWLSGTYIERVTYIGVVPLIFALYGFFRKQERRFWFFVISAVIVLLLTFDTFITRIVYFFQLPFISTAVPTRALFLYCFSVSIIAGFGLDSFLKNQNKKIFLRTAGILGGVYFLSWVFVFAFPTIVKDLSLSWVSNLHISKRNLVIPTSLFTAGTFFTYLIFYFKKNVKHIFILILFLSLLDLFYFFHKITPFAPKETIYPKTEVIEKLRSIQGIGRSWGYGSGYISTNIQSVEKIFATDGYNALHLKRYGELVSSSKDGRIPDRIPGADANISPGYGKEDLRKNVYRQRLLSLLGVKYILNKNDFLGTDYVQDKAFSEEIYKLIWQKSPWQIYENMDALPRVFLASEYVVEKNEDEIIKIILDEKFNLKDKLILEETVSPMINFSKDKDAKVEIIEYTANKIALRTSTSENMLLFLSDNYFPGWKVSIDQENGKIYRADYSFRAVPVPKGFHEVKFWYSPSSFVLGLWISTISFSTMLLLLVIFSRRRNNVK